MSEKQNAAHTSGPWASDGTFVTARAGEDLIADIWQLNGLSAPECEANARLIAAAPDLLAACEALVEQFNAYRANWRGDKNGWVSRFGLTQDLEAAQSAIAKAKGQS